MKKSYMNIKYKILINQENNIKLNKLELLILYII